MDSGHSSRLSISHLLIWSAGIAVAFSAKRYVQELETTVHQTLYPWQDISPRTMSLREVAFMFAYGSGLALGVCAWRSGNFWNSPGKILLVLFGVLAIFDFIGLLFAFNYALFTHNDMIGPIPFYAFSPIFGHVFVLAAGLFVVSKAETRRYCWSPVWISIVLYAVLMLLHYWHSYRGQYLFGLDSEFCLAVISGLPFVAVSSALATDLLLRRNIDWWTIVIAFLVPFVWMMANHDWIVG